MNKNDRRARKTEKELQTALIELMREKELKDITVGELTEKADIHRATFYTHYEDIYALYDEIERGILDYICERLNWEPNHVYKENFVFLSIIFTLMQTFSPFCFRIRASLIRYAI